MMRPAEDVEVFLCREVVDFRKSINGLSALVEHELGLNPFGPQLFVFCNRKRDKLRILYWERNGYVLWHKRLEKHKFPWPSRDKGKSDVVAMTGRELSWLLDGIDLFRIKPHEELTYQSVA
jgi:transposase